MHQAVVAALPYLLNDLDPVVLANLGYSRKDMLRWCKYDGRNCEQKEFTDLVDPDSGKCFSFNWDAKNYADRSGERSGKGEKYQSQLEF